MGTDLLNSFFTSWYYCTLERKRLDDTHSSVSQPTNELKSILGCGGVERLTVASDSQFNIKSVTYRK